MQGRYFEALLREIDGRAGGEEIETVYFGGGTPSRTAPEHLERIMERLRTCFVLTPDAEFSLEANPEDVSSDSIDFWRSLGVNRLSIGVQSFHDRELLPLGRVHGSESARHAVRLAVDSGIRTSLDLILGLPNQDATSFAASLESAIELGAGHLSIYMLDLEEGSALAARVASGVVSLPDEDVVAQSYLDAIERLHHAGFEQYEISNFARPGRQCRHNLRYWRREPYHGFGLGAHSFIGARRFANSRDLMRYIEDPLQPEFSERLGDTEEKRETIFLRLRQPAGLNYDEVVRLCGREAMEWIDQGVSAGWLRREGERVAFTPSGFLLSTDLISQLF
jgi:oxygen-independent coproporphyrinogen-3 oxidase